MPTVSNATPLIALSRIGQLKLLHDLFGKILVPRAVYDELVVKGKGHPGCEAVADAAWIYVQAVQDPDLVIRLRARGLGLGEAEAIALASESHAPCVTDDLAAVRAAKSLGVAVRRTLKLLVAAKKKGLIPSVRPLMDSLRNNNFWIDDATYDRVLDLADE